MKKITTRLFNEFFNSEKSAGLLLLACTIISLSISNSSSGEAYTGIWHTNLAGHHLVHWINDGLMAVFFLLIGLELKRELYIGELSDIKKASLPAFAALGGMLVPAGIYMLINQGTPYQAGAGIPMATDIAFALGILSLLGNRVPASIKIFLTALAIIDDLGAILVIAFFYSTGLSLINLGAAIGLFGLLLILNKLKVRWMIVYLIGGIAMWYFMLQSGVHATIAGVLLAFAIPFEKGTENSLSYKLQHALHNPVSFFILPVFALANTAIIIKTGLPELAGSAYGLGIAAGLVIGKPVGITALSWLATKTKLCSLPEGVNWKSIAGVGMLGGIGFTMSMFITILAFGSQTELIDNSKLSILIASLLSGVFGFIILKNIFPTGKGRKNKTA